VGKNESASLQIWSRRLLNCILAVLALRNPYEPMTGDYHRKLVQLKLIFERQQSHVAVSCLTVYKLLAASCMIGER